MSTAHPSREEIAGFLAPGSRSGGRAAAGRVVRHLLRQCPECRVTLCSLTGPTKRSGRDLNSQGSGRVDSRPRQSEYDTAFARAEQAIGALLAPVPSVAAQPEELLAELEELPEEAQLSRVAADQELQTCQFVEHLLLMGNAVRYQDPAKTLHYTSLARIAVESAREASIGNALRLADLRSQALAHQANAFRINGRARAAEEALRFAEMYRLQGSGDPMLHACILERSASLRIAQRRFVEAIEKAEEAANIYRELEKPSLLASTMVQRAIASLYGGKPYAATSLLNTAIPLIDMEDNPHLLFSALHNLVRCYIDLGCPDKALKLFGETRDIYGEFLDPILVLRAGWHEGQILRDLGRLDEAETVFLRVRDGFLDRDLPHDAALVSLDLAEAYVRLKDFAALKETIAAAVPVFQAIGAEREILASWLQVQEVAHEETLALEVVRNLSQRLGKAGQKSPTPPQ